tara:strand:+ start:355 stop:696 length:342 start_codon:yes stop_codon:yes gene_type:complete
MITLILFIVFYVVPAIGAYQTFRRNYSPGGDWQYSRPNKMDVFIVFAPLGNIVVMLIGLIDYLQETEARSFFRLDKDDIDEEELMEEVLRKEAEAFNKWKSAHDRYRKKLQKN